MTIYMVQHQLCRPDWEDEWNDQVWARNLFEGVGSAPAVAEGQCLVCLDGAASNMTLSGVPLAVLPSTGFHKTTPYRVVAVIPQHQGTALPARDGLTVYLPISAQLGPLY